MTIRPENRSNRRRRGQTLIFMGLATTVLFGITGLVFDYSMINYTQSVLNASTQAAALAGGEAMTQPGATTTSTTAVITQYSSASGNLNYNPMLSGASLMSGYPKFACLSTVTSMYGIQCYGPGTANAIRVAQRVTIPLYFLRIFGSSSVTITAEATASMKGAAATPFNVVIIVDTTRSMTDDDTDSNCKSTRISCALAGVAVLLQNLSPCQWSLGTCGTVTNGNVNNSVDRVSLLAFPPVSTASVANDYNCSGNSITTEAYQTPFPSTSTYQIVGFSSDYRTSDTATKLNASSNIVAAVQGNSSGTVNPCIQVVGGFGTYYAQVITAAQAYLVAEQASFPTSKNVMILLSDGDATASSGDMPGASTTSGTYMSSVQECHQAVTAAAAAATAGTRVYAVAYGAEASGCPTDTAPTITPCQTMQQIASSPGYFFSDYTATGGDSTCISASQPVTNLSQIFQVIATDLTVSKLIPNSTT